MSWLKDIVRPRIKAIVGESSEVEARSRKLWSKCNGCSETLYSRDLENWSYVCPHCGHHVRMPLTARLKSLFDEGRYQRLAYASPPEDPLRFRDSQRYTERLKEQRARTGEEDAVIAAEGRIQGMPVAFVGLNFDFMGGSMGIAVGSGFIAAVDRAIEKTMPLICLTASGGARMQEGPFSLMQLPRTLSALQRFRLSKQPYIVILTDPTMGGVTASFGMLGDIQIAEKGARIGFAGPRVIEQTVREKLPEGFQRAECLRENGTVDIVVERRMLRRTLAQLLRLICAKQGQARIDRLDGLSDRLSDRLPDKLAEKRRSLTERVPVPLPDDQLKAAAD